MSLEHLFENNRDWARSMTDTDPEFFTRLVGQQAPQYLWIGCSDSRVPANEIIGLQPGDVFVHRNVANLVVHSDLNCLSVLQYAVEVLRVRHIIVCGHYGCGGVQAALADARHGLIDNWLGHLRDLVRSHRRELWSLAKPARIARLCELNVVAQAINVAETTIVRSAWQRNHLLSVHGLIYSIEDGLLRDLKVSMHNEVECRQQLDALDDRTQSAR